MAYLTNQWLNGAPMRNRKHNTEEIDLSLTDAQCDHEDVRVTIELARKNDD
jgi:hypothetical protein